MNLEILNQELINEDRVITLYEIMNIINKDRALKGLDPLQHSKQISKVDKKIAESSVFGTVSRTDIVYNDKGQTTQTYHFTKKQALVIGALLDIDRAMLIVNKLEELSKPMTIEQLLAENTKVIGLLQNKVITLENKIEDDKPKVLFADNVTASINSLLIREWVKAISTDEVNIGQNKAFSWLRENGYLMKNNEPYQKYIDNSYFEVTESSVVTPKGVRVYKTTRITGKGQVALVDKINNYFTKE